MKEKTLVIIKPHAVARGLVGSILQRFENVGLEIVKMKSVKASADLWDRFYPSDENWFENVGSKTSADMDNDQDRIISALGTSDKIEIGKLVKSWLVSNMSQGIAIAIIFEGNEAIKKTRTLCGKTLPNQAAPGTIRFDYSCDSPVLANKEKRPVFNIVHASDPDEIRDGIRAVDYEIRVIFPEYGR